jgi:hypothetical protein
MKRLVPGSALIVAFALVVPVLRADVKTREKTTFKMEGLMGALMNRAMGGADGITSNVALKGNRMARFDDTTGQITDLTEEKIYSIEFKRKEYSVLTFAEMRAQIEKMKQDMAKQQKDMDPADKQKAEEAAKQLEVDVDVKQTGQSKTIAGHETKENILTITLREKGKTLEEGGGMVMTNTMWMAPRVAELDELAAFSMKMFKAVYGEAFDARQLGAVSALIPGLAQLAERMGTEARKLQGTPLATTTVYESVKSAEQMKAAASQQPSSGGGLGGMLGRRIMGGRGQTQQRSTMLTTTSETLSIATTVSEADVAVPPAFKLVKK